jgi:phosphoribosylaminoimidazole-succinocarboxamide synthase
MAIRYAYGEPHMGSVTLRQVWALTPKAKNQIPAASASTVLLRRHLRVAHAATRHSRWFINSLLNLPIKLSLRNTMSALLSSDLPLPLIHRGKVRDVYAISDKELLIVATDRLSAFDVVLPDPIPGKGALLTQLSNFWFAQTAQLCPNHMLNLVLPDGVDPEIYGARTVRCKRLKALPVEAIARGYLVGSGFKEYQNTGAVCGLALPKSMRLAQQLEAPIFTPSTKAAVGDHDVNVSFAAIASLIGSELAQAIREATLSIYQFAAEYALQRGVIIADTKLEFGLDENDQLVVMDEMLTPDSSRFWPADEYQVGSNPPSYDKQFARDYLESIHWNKAPPAPALPASIIAGTTQRYQQAVARLTGPNTPRNASR